MNVGLLVIGYVVIFMLIFVFICIASSIESDPEKEAKDPSLARKRKKKQAGFLFAGILCFGLLFVFMGYCIYATDQHRMIHWISVQAVISGTYYDNLDESRTFLVNYIFNGNVYEKIRVGYYSDLQRIGDAITILVDPAKPTSIQSKPSAPIVPMIFGGVGGLISLVSLYNIISVLLGTSRWIVTSNNAPKTISDGPDATAVIAGKGLEAEWQPDKEPSKYWRWLFYFVIIAIIGGAWGYGIYGYWQTNRNMAYVTIAILVFVTFNIFRTHLKIRKRKMARKIHSHRCVL